MERVVKPEVKLKWITPEPYMVFYTATRNCFWKGKLDELENKYNEFNAKKLMKKIIDSRHDSPLEQITMQYSLEGVSRSFLAQITRHRLVSFMVSSQHYQRHDDFLYVELDEYKSPDMFREYHLLMNIINQNYKKMIANGLPHYIARQVLPNSTACKIMMTLNLRELRHILSVRMTKDNTPEIQKISAMMFQELYDIYPDMLYGIGGDKNA